VQNDRKAKPYFYFLRCRFDNHTDAAQAITAKHGSTLEGYTVKCSWGKEGAAVQGTTVGNVTSNFTNGVSLRLLNELQ